MDPRVRWFEMPVTRQISNIGSEVARAIRWKNKGDYQKARNFCNKAIEFWLLTEEDPKNRHRVGEFNNAVEELRDFFLGDNIYQTTDEMLTRYYDAFLYRE
jgi:hypothetical protein